MNDVSKKTRTSDSNRARPVVIIGAGPIGLAAAAHLIARGVTPVVLEQGAAAGAAMRQWGHVRVFTPWRFVIDKAVRRLLDATHWTAPDADGLPTGQEIVDQYLLPAAMTPDLHKAIVYDATVVGVSKAGLSKSSSQGRDNAPFTVHYTASDGGRQVIEAAAVIDASGTWANPNPIGTDGLPVPGESENAGRIAYGIPDCLGDARASCAGKRTLVLGGGHSAVNVALDLSKLQADHDGTTIYWGLRHNGIDRLLGGNLNELLPARGAVGAAAKQAIDRGALTVLAPTEVRRIVRSSDGLSVEISLDGEARKLAVDRIIVCTGFKPDLEMLRELRLDLDGIVEAPVSLAPLIDPNLHSCGTVPAHGVRELSHPEHNLFIVGMKSYGRAPTFLMKTGYAQVSSIADHLACELGIGNQPLADLAAIAEYGLGQASDLSCCGATLATVCDRSGTTATDEAATAR